MFAYVFSSLQFPMLLFEERIAMELQELVSQFEAPPTTGALNQPIDFSKIIEQNAKRGRVGQLQRNHKTSLIRHT